MLLSRIFIFRNTICPDFKRTIVGVARPIANAETFSSFFFALFINTRLWSARPHGFAHVFRLPDINSLTGMVAAADKAIREPAKFASEFAR